MEAEPARILAASYHASSRFNQISVHQLRRTGVSLVRPQSPDLTVIARDIMQSSGYAFESHETWFHCKAPNDGSGPTQGWKLHVSAYDGTAAETLRRCAHVLTSAKVSFKLARSMEVLAYLNEGGGGGSQRGKFITIYPASTQEATALAEAVHRATLGLCGPIIPSDRQYRPGSSVFYRYGAFRGPYTISPIGQVTTSLRTPQGKIVPDIRGLRFVQPSWVTNDPFGGNDPDRDVRLWKGRYLPVTELYRSFRGSIWAGADLENGCVVVLKTIGAVPSSGRLENEARLLRRLAGMAVPTVIDQFYDAARSTEMLVLSDAGEYSCEQRIHLDGPLSVAAFAQFAIDLAGKIAAVHAAGIIHRDIKPSNIIISDNAGARLIDFDIAADVASSDRALSGRGTEDYSAPQQWQWAGSHPADDIYSLGAVLFFAVTGAQPKGSWVPAVRAARLAELRPDCPAWISDLIDHCMQFERDNRPNEDAIVAHCKQHRRKTDCVLVKRPQVETIGCASDLPRAPAQQFADAILAEAGSSAIAHNIWRGAVREVIPRRDLAAGDAGPLLALAETVLHFDLPVTTEIRALIERCDRTRLTAGEAHPGLFVGEAGWLWALTRGATMVGDSGLRQRCAEAGAALQAIPHFSPDLYHGSAGRLRFHVLMYRAGGGDVHLQGALDAFRYLAATANWAADRAYWIMPEDLEAFGGSIMYGYAHGAAGIADALLDLYSITDEQEIRELIFATTRWILDAVVLSDDGSKADWPTSPEGKDRPRLWCRGATGIGVFLLRVSQVIGPCDLKDRICTLMPRIFQSVEQARWLNNTVCHGHAGSLDFVMDLERAGFGTSSTQACSERLASMISLSALKQAGSSMFPGDDDKINSSYMIGSTGISLTMLRYHDRTFRGASIRPEQPVRAVNDDNSYLTDIERPGTVRSSARPSAEAPPPTSPPPT